MKINNCVRGVVLSTAMVVGAGSLTGCASMQGIQDGAAQQTIQQPSPEKEMRVISTNETLSMLKGLSDGIQEKRIPGTWACTENLGISTNSSGGKYLQYHYFCEKSDKHSTAETLSPGMVYEHLKDVATPYHNNLSCKNSEFVTINGNIAKTGTCNGPDPGGHVKQPASAGTGPQAGSTMKFLDTGANILAHIAKFAVLFGAP